MYMALYMWVSDVYVYTVACPTNCAVCDHGVGACTLCNSGYRLLDSTTCESKLHLILSTHSDTIMNSISIYAIYGTFCVSIYLSVYLSLSIYIYLSIYLSICMYLYVSICI